MTLTQRAISHAILLNPNAMFSSKSLRLLLMWHEQHFFNPTSFTTSSLAALWSL
jgi:hypothetical protein